MVFLSSVMTIEMPPSELPLPGPPRLKFPFGPEIATRLSKKL